MEWVEEMKGGLWDWFRERMWWRVRRVRVYAMIGVASVG